MIRRFDQRSSFGPSLEWEQLPLLGAGRQRSSLRLWILSIAFGVLFPATVIVAVIAVRS